MKSWATMISLGAAGAVGGVVLLATCSQAPKMPALDGVAMEFRRSDGGISKGGAGYASTLQFSWFGSGCHVIQLGDAVILLDPFVTNDLKLAGMRSDPEKVEATLGRISVPDAVLVNHSHHDHILDGYAAMTLDAWKRAGVLLYGGQSCKNLLAGWSDDEVLGRCRVIPDDGKPHSFSVPVRARGYSAKVTAYRTEHAPHLKCGFTLSNGLIREPRRTVPTSPLQFKTGESFNYLIELSGPGGKFTVFYLGAPFHLDKRPDSIPPAGTDIDVAIILAPNADNVDGYPEAHLAQLRPKHIVLSHYNTFVKEDPDSQATIAGVDLVKMPKLLRDIQSSFSDNAVDYPEFEKLHVPAITRISDGGSARNVVLIQR